MMIAKKRLAKRSIIGTRIAAPGNDGRFYPGVIDSTKTGSDGKSLYTIKSKNGVSKEVTDADIIGPGFHSISSFVLKPEQRVFLTYQGREISGTVIRHQPHIDEVLVRIEGSSLKNSPNASPTEETLEVRKRIDEIRILESRKSSRLVDQDKDFARFAEVGVTGVKAPGGGGGLTMLPSLPVTSPASLSAVPLSVLGRKRSVSNCIDVPHAFVKAQRRRKRHLSAPGLGEDDTIGAICEGSSDTSSDEDDDVEVMDEKMAAMVLTTLSCSPVSPKVLNIPGNILHQSEGGPLSCSWTSGSSSYWSGKSEEITNESPIASTSSYFKDSQSRAAPLNSPVDEGIELEDAVDYKKKNKVQIIYQCTWPGCREQRSSCPSIEQHVRMVHLGPKPPSESNVEDSDDSDHEEEFYYTEIEMVVSEPSNSPSATSSMCLTSASQTSHLSYPPEKQIWKSFQITDAAKFKQPSSTSSTSLHTVSAEVHGQKSELLSLTSDSVTKASNLLPNNPDAKRLSSPTIIHATPSTDHDYTAKIQNTSTPSYRSPVMASQGMSPHEKAIQPEKDHLIDIFLAMEQSKPDQQFLLSSSQSRQINPQTFNQLRLTTPSEAYSIGNFSTDSTHRNLPWSAQAHPTLTGNISLPKPIRPNMVSSAPGTAVTCPSFTGSFPGTHFHPSLNHNSPKMIISTSLGVSSGGIGKPHTKKIRGEMKKCRKVYGMENRDMWCTQCRWKKACTRFTE